MSGSTDKDYTFDARRVALEEEEQVEFWVEHFAVSREKLEEVISIVGDNPVAVADYTQQM